MEPNIAVGVAYGVPVIFLLAYIAYHAIIEYRHRRALQSELAPRPPVFSNLIGDSLIDPITGMPRAVSIVEDIRDDHAPRGPDADSARVLLDFFLTRYNLLNTIPDAIPRILYFSVDAEKEYILYHVRKLATFAEKYHDKSLFRQPMTLAFAMGTHPRLGAQSPLNALPNEVLSLITRDLFFTAWGGAVHDYVARRARDPLFTTLDIVTTV
jgi:hypothetical protein